MTTPDYIKVIWIDQGRESECPSNPAFPDGMAFRSSAPKSCHVDLPYPAPRCGVHVIMCELCGNRMAITAAGRPDDPISLEMACKPVLQ